MNSLQSRRADRIVKLMLRCEARKKKKGSSLGRFDRIERALSEEATISHEATKRDGLEPAPKWLEGQSCTATAMTQPAAPFPGGHQPQIVAPPCGEIRVAHKLPRRLRPRRESPIRPSHTRHGRQVSGLRSSLLSNLSPVETDPDCPWTTWSTARSCAGYTSNSEFGGAPAECVRVPESPPAKFPLPLHPPT